MNDEYAISIAFHEKYYNELYGHLVKVYLKDGNIVEGDEFYDESILMGYGEKLQVSQADKLLLWPWPCFVS